MTKNRKKSRKTFGGFTTGFVPLSHQNPVEKKKNRKKSPF